MRWMLLAGVAAAWLLLAAAPVRTTMLGVALAGVCSSRMAAWGSDQYMPCFNALVWLAGTQWFSTLGCVNDDDNVTPV
jgi:hypothetical protein